MSSMNLIATYDFTLILLDGRFALNNDRPNTVVNSLSITVDRLDTACVVE